MNDLVSIVMPVHNAEKTVERAVRSALNQTYSQIEVIVINDGSIDGTRSVLQKLSSADERIQLIDQQNAGVSASRNNGLSQAHGKFVMFLDSDDWYEPDMVEQMLQFMDEQCQLVCCGFSIWTDRLVRKIDLPFSKFDFSQKSAAISTIQKGKCFNALWNKIFRTDLIRNSSIKMDVSVDIGEDLLFVIDYISAVTGSIVCLPNCFYNYQISSGGLQSKSRDDNFFRRMAQLERLKQLYVQQSYPLDDVYVEMLRNCYTSIMEIIQGTLKQENIKVIKKIFSSEQFKLITKEIYKCPAKFQIFKRIIRTRNIRLTYYSVFLFKKIQEFRGYPQSWEIDV